jgi:O-antigen/teichoic acid export membrane protein
MESLTVDERSFRNPKLRNAGLIAYKAFADLAGKGSLFVITIAAARRLSPEAFGAFSLGSTLGWMLAVATDFGIQLHLAREVARHPADARQLLRSWLRVRLWTAAAAIGAVAIGTSAAGWTAPYSVPVAVFALVYGCSGLIELLNYFYRGLSRSDVESSLTLWQRGATLVCGLAALAWRPDVTVLAVALLLPVVVTLGVSVRMALRLAGPDARVPDERAPATGDAVAGAGPRADPSMTSVFRRDVWPIGAGIVLSALYFRIDVLLLQLWSGMEPVGLYNAVFRLVEALRLFPAAVMAVMLPALCRATDLRPLARAATPVTLGAVAAAAILWAAAGWLIPALYQARYDAAVPAFRILLLSFPLMTLNMALTHQLIGWDGQRAYAALCAAALVVNVALNARLIPAASIDGAAWATLATELFLTAGCAIALSAVAAKRAGATIAESAVAG